MTGEAIIAKLTNLEAIEGADRIVQSKILGETVIVSVEHSTGDVGVLFDCETQLSREFCYNNNLYRHSNLNKDESKVGYIEDDRRVRAIRLKGVKCSGLWLPLSCLDFIEGNKNLDLSKQFKEINGVRICEKYINQATRNQHTNKVKSVPENLVPTFKEHIDTENFMKSQGEIKNGDLIIITEKLHGTSGRCGYLETKKPTTMWQGFLHWLSTKDWGKYVSSYEFVVGSRRVVKSIGENTVNNKNYYSEDLWTKISKELFENKLEKGETVYFEIVGYTPGGTPIMGSQSNEKLKNFMDKKEYVDFLAKYGKETVFSYGCSSLGGLDRPKYKVFVYRITLTNEDGHTIDYSWDQVKLRCEKLGVNTVPELHRFVATKWENTRNGEDKYLADHYGNRIETIVDVEANNDSELFPTNLREGVCIRVENGKLTPKIFKHKSYLFKVLEGIIKDSNTVDLEEAQS